MISQPKAGGRILAYRYQTRDGVFWHTREVLRRDVLAKLPDIVAANPDVVWLPIGIAENWGQLPTNRDIVAMLRLPRQLSWRDVALPSPYL